MRGIDEGERTQGNGGHEPLERRKMIEKLHTFIESERERFMQYPANDIDDNNSFAFAFYSVLRYYGYLSIISNRYREVAQQVSQLAANREAATQRREAAIPSRIQSDPPGERPFQMGSGELGEQPPVE